MDKSTFSKLFDHSGPWPTVRECLAQGLGSYRTQIGRGDMTVAHARHLIETYAALYKHADSPAVGASPPFAREGFACGDGWFGIIDHLSMKLVEDPYLVVVQVKEKMVELRVYLDSVDGAPEPDLALAARLVAERTAASEASRRTCELCGAPGKLEETSRHWLFVRCKSCRWLDDMAEACRRLEDLVKGAKKNAFVRAIDLVAAATYLATLPSSWSAELAGVRVAMWHARPGSDMEGIRADDTGPALRRRLLNDARADVLVVGHTHDAFELRAGKGRIFNPGACCSKTYSIKQSGALVEPAGYRPATFGVLELPSKMFTVLCALDGREPGDLEDIRIAESRLAAIDAGLVKPIPLDEAMRKLGIFKPPKTRRRRRKRPQPRRRS